MAKEKMSIKERLQSAREQERQGELEKAIAVYKSVVQSHPLNASAYNRLMVIYRKQKKYRDELAIIKQAVGAYEKDLLEEQQAWKKAHRKSVSTSQALAESLGLLDDKGLPAYEEPQVNIWKKREMVVTKRLASPKRQPVVKRRKEKVGNR